MSTPSSPKIHRPKPRRPYEQSSPTFLAHQNQNQSSSNLLSPSSYTDEREAPSRTQSILNLTSSTLLGIYSPTGYQPDNDHENEYELPSTPWGTGSETPQRLSTIPIRRHTPVPPASISTLNSISALGFRSVLLFGIGMGYGLLVRHLHDDRQLAPFQVEGIIKPRNDWRYLVFWGVAGVGLGSLMPWVDMLFSKPGSVGVEGSRSKRNSSRGVEREKEEGEDEDTGILGADWTPVVRSVGAFVGIAYAIRKLPWATPLQASLTLFLVNPVLWYLIDRSAPGFILSASVGAVGTSLLLASNPDMMPSPASSTSNSTWVGNVTGLGDGWGVGGFGGFGLDFVGKEKVEVGIWILSVLFCSCVCFGNVGRRLALRGGRRR